MAKENKTGDKEEKVAKKAHNTPKKGRTRYRKVYKTV